jgi:hypothetical protein
MKNRKKEIEWKKDTKKMKRLVQVVNLRLRTGYTMATHGYIIDDYFFFSTVDLILGF